MADFDLDQSSTQAQQPIGGSTDVTSPAYQAALVNQYGINTAPAFQQGQRSLQSDLAAHGLDNSGAAAAGSANLEQSRTAQMGNEAEQVGAGQAQQGFEKQTAATAQQYALQRIQQEQANAMELERAKQSFEQQQGMMQGIEGAASGAGQIAGDIYGGGDVRKLTDQMLAMYKPAAAPAASATLPGGLPAGVTEYPDQPGTGYGAYDLLPA
jgi:hypothetical protein